MIKHFVNFERKQFFRSTYWQKSIALNILLGFFAVYMILSFLIMGIAIYPILEDKFPDKNPLTIINGILFFWFLADLMMRFFLQKLPVMNIKPFLILPLKRRKIVNYVLQKSAISFFNFLPLFAVIPFGVMLILNNHGTTTGLVWIGTMLIFTLIINFLNFIIESKSAETELSFLPIILIASALFALNYFEIVSFATLLGSAMNAIIGTPFLILIPILLLVGIYYTNFQILGKKLYVDEGVKSKTEEASTTNMEWTKKFGSIAPFLQLDLKLITRNKRPKSSIFFLAMGLFYGLFFYPQPMYADKEWLYVFVGTFVTGIFMIIFGQFIPAWDSGYYKLLMSQNIKYKEYLNSKYSLMIMVSIIMFVLSIPYVYFGWKILVVHFATLIYNLGINVYVLLYAGSFNRKKIDLTQRAAFNYQGTGAVQWIVGFPLLFVPVLIFLLPYFTLGFEAAVATLIILGISGIVLHQKLMNFITKKYLQSKHKMIAAFEQSN